MDIHEVVVFAVDAHKGQFRKAFNLPYIVHPLEVLSQISEWGVDDEDVRAVALCHDVLEDTAVTQEQLEVAIGLSASEIVNELTFRVRENLGKKHEQKKTYRNSFVGKSIEALVIKWADACCNTQNWMSSDHEYAKKYWAKCDPIGLAVMQRKAEIDERFGEDVYPRMMYSKTTLSRMLAD